MAGSMDLGKKTAVRRLQQDYIAMLKDPVPYIEAHPLSEDILQWHYVIKGPEDSPYEGGTYHGMLKFPPEFPFKPPSIFMLTPNGRFKTNYRLCLSMSDYHPNTWNPAWTVVSIITGLLSFMLENESTVGSIPTTVNEKKRLAVRSNSHNAKDPLFCQLFPNIVKAYKTKRNEEKQKNLEQEQDGEEKPVETHEELSDDEEVDV